METLFSMETVCQEFGISPNTLRSWIEAGLVEQTMGGFTVEQVRRIWSITSLNRDLDVNLAGIQIILDLTGQIRQMQVALREASLEIQRLRSEKQFHLRVIEERFGPIEWQVDP